MKQKMMHCGPHAPSFALARRVLALAELLTEAVEHAQFSVGVLLPGFTGIPSSGGILYAVSPDGRVHSSAGSTFPECKTRLLEAHDAFEALRTMCGELERRALAAEERRLAEAAARRRQTAAQKNLNARLKAKGIA